LAEWRALRTGDDVYMALARAWTKSLGVLFAIGAVSGTILSFELGILWPRFMGRFGEVVGLPFAMEGIAFFIEAIFVGLYLYALVPKAGLKPFKDRLTEIEPLLPGVAKGVAEFVHATPVTQLPHDASFVRTLSTIPRWVFQARARRRGIEHAARADKLFRVVAKTDRRLARDLVAELGVLAAGEVDTNAGGAVMRSWRSLHRFLAILMLLSVSVHIVVAWYFGFRWIF